MPERFAWTKYQPCTGSGHPVAWFYFISCGPFYTKTKNIDFNRPLQNVLMKDAAQKTLHESVEFSHIYWLFHWKKLEKQVLSKSQFFSATGNILEMQPVVFMNWCDSNARASKKNKPTGHRSLPHGEQVDGLFSSPMVLMLLLLRLCVIPWWYW